MRVQRGDDLTIGVELDDVAKGTELWADMREPSKWQAGDQEREDGVARGAGAVEWPAAGPLAGRFVIRRL